MTHSFYELYVHIIFSTKDRKRWLDDSIRPRVHAYLATLVRDSGCPFAIVGGPDDHIHVLAGLGKRTRPVEMIGKIKQESSKFIKTLGPDYGDFFWQQGYALFSVGPTKVSDVAAYVERQVQHHCKQSFQEEVRAFLDTYKIEYNETYVWD